MSKVRHSAPARWLGNPWFGITILALIFVYAAIGSAVPPVRGALEQSEMQVFEHWLFVLLIALFCLSLIVATLTRISLRLVNLGAIVTHVGLLVLTAGCVWYFGRKIEGDVLLISPRVELLTADGRQVRDAELLADLGQVWEQFVPAVDGFVRLEVVERRAEGADPLAEVVVRAQLDDGPPRLITLSAGAAPAALGDEITLRLRTFASQSHFYDNDAAALYYGPKGAGLPRFVEIEGLPLHRERYLPDGEPLRDSLGRPVPSKRTSPHLSLGPLRIPTGWFEGWQMPIRLDTPELPFDVEITGYVPYIAGTQSVIAGDGPQENPLIALRVGQGADAAEFALEALSPRGSQTQLGGLPVPLEFRWVNSPEELQAALRPLTGPHELSIEVIDPPVRRMVAAAPGVAIRIEETPYELTVRALLPSWSLATAGYEGATSPVALIGINDGQRSYRRTVVERFPELTQDVDEHGARHAEGLLDRNLILRYRSSVPGRVVVLAGPDLPLTLAVFQPDGAVQYWPLAEGEPRLVRVGADEFPVTLLSYHRRGRWLTQPVIQPLPLRRPNQGRGPSAIRLTLTGRGELAGWRDTRWCVFSHYPRLQASPELEGFGARPADVVLPDGRTYELVYSRAERELGVTLVPGKLSVTFFPGRHRAHSWRSDFYVQNERGELTPAAVYTNQTYTIGEWTLFQSGAEARGHWRWTILGVGNRHGMWAMILGSILITAGCLYAFYVKPILLRRARAAAQERTAATDVAAGPCAGRGRPAGFLRPTGASAATRGEG